MSDTHARTISYVRSSMIAPSAPPTAQTGVVKWMRENLFSSALNAILSVAALYLIWTVVSGLVPWLYHSVWIAGSLTECREVLSVVAPLAEHGGGCFAVISERWMQLLFGFYRYDLYWRPISVFVLMFVAVAPILFADRLPRQMLWFSALYPFLATWLLWGGSFWLPILAILGFVVGAIAARLAGSVAGMAGAVAAGVIAAVGWWIYATPMISDSLHRMVAASNMAEQQEAAAATINTATDAIAAIEAQQAEVQERISDLEVRKNELLATLQVAEGEQVNVSPEQKDEFEHAVASLQGARFGLNALNRDVFLLQKQVTEARSLLSSIDSLPTWEADLPKLQADILAARAALPDSVRNMVAVEEVDPGTPADVIRALSLVIDAEQKAAQARAALPDDLLALESADDAPLGTDNDAVEALETVIAAEAAARQARAELPELVRNMMSVDEVDRGTPAADVSALSAVLAQETAAVSLQQNIDAAYQQIGRMGLEPVGSRDFGGFMLALIIGISGIVLSLPLGVLLALARQSDLPVVKYAAVAFIEVIRGVPLIVWLFTASLLLKYFLPKGTNMDLVLRVVVMVTLFSAAYIAEVVRGGLAALPKGQYEAADSLGLDYWKSMRLIILPQALKISIPGIVNTFIGLFKDTTLVGIIGLLDPLGLASAIRASTEWNGVYWELFIFIGVVFFVFCFSMGRYSLWLEHKLARGHR